MKEGRSPAPDRPPFRVKRALSFHLAFFFVFLFVFGPVESAHNHQPGNYNVQKNSRDLLETDLVFDHGQSANFPFDPTSNPWEPDPTDKTDKEETSDNFDDEPAKLFCRSLGKQRFDVVAAKRLLRQLSLSSKNRKTVSLFILHHSWKSFLH